MQQRYIKYLNNYNFFCERIAGTSNFNHFIDVNKMVEILSYSLQRQHRNFGS
jgi:hypothetical protein